MTSTPLKLRDVQDLLAELVLQESQPLKYFHFVAQIADDSSEVSFNLPLLN